MMELGINAVKSSWFWWTHMADFIPFWNPFGAYFSLLILVAIFGWCVKRIREGD